MESYKNAVKLIKNAILQSQYRAVRHTNIIQLSLYFSIGKYVSENTRKNVWGIGAIDIISNQLQKELPGLRGFSSSNIKNMRQFYEQWSCISNRQPVTDELSIAENDNSLPIDILINAIRQPMAVEIDMNKFMAVSFTHHMEILSKTSDLNERIYYINLTADNLLNKYTLREIIKQDAYHHQSKMPNNFNKTLQSVDNYVKAISVFKDEYFLDFINTQELDETDAEVIEEKVLEQSIVNNIKKFILSFGKDFVFVGNQYRLIAADREFFIDLLFFNRELNCLCAVELKKGEFKPAYLGQLQTYLRLLDEHVKKPHENPSIGIVLCKHADKSFVELVIQDYNKPMGVATYRTNADMPEQLKRTLPDIEELKKQL